MLRASAMIPQFNADIFRLSQQLGIIFITPGEENVSCIRFKC